MAHQREYDLVIYDLDQLPIQLIKDDIVCCVARHIRVAVVGSPPKSELEGRLQNLGIYGAYIRVYGGENLQKSLNLAMAAGSYVSPQRVCYVGNSPDNNAIARAMKIRTIRGLDEFIAGGRRATRIGIGA